MKISHGYFSMQIGGVEQNFLRTMPRFLEEDAANHELILTHPEGPLLDKLPEDLTVSSPEHTALFSQLYDFYRDSDLAHLYTINENPIHRLPAYLSNTPIIDNPRNLIAVPHSNRVSRVTCASEAIADVQDCPDNVKIIPNGIEINEQASPTYEKFQSDEPLRLIEIGRSDKERSHRAEDFMPLLKQTYPDLECHVLGRNGEDKNGIIYHGYVEDPSNLYEQSHFLTHFVETEPFGMTPLEAYRAGVIPIVSGEGGIRELIEHTETGFFLESPNKGEVIKQLKMVAEKFYDDPSFWIPMAKNGYELVSSRFSVDTHVEQYLSLYRTVHNEPHENRFPEVDWDSAFDQFFRQITLGDYQVNPSNLLHDQLSKPIERDLGRLLEADELREEEPGVVLDILEEIESDSFQNHYEVFSLRASVLQTLGQADKAIQAAQRAIDREPDLPEPYFIVADGHLNNQDVDAALEALKTFRDRHPSYEPVKEMIQEMATLRR